VPTASLEVASAMRGRLAPRAGYFFCFLRLTFHL
jgi:hypothetical protein